MGYSWDWGIFFKSTGIGQQIYLDWFISGLGWTLTMASSAWILALFLGIILGVLRNVPNRLLSAFSASYITLFRNIPLLVQLFSWYFLIPDYLPDNLQTWFKQGLSPTTSAYISALLCLGLFTAARIAEQIRTGIQAIPLGQSAAATAIGLKLPQIYCYVLLPQAIRIIMPPLTSELLNIFKNSTVVSLIGLMELLAATKQVSEFSAHLFEAFTLATIIYFMLNMSLMKSMRWLERKLAIPGFIVAGNK